MSRQNRPFDLVIYGASSFTGALVCEHLVGYGGRYKVGVAGRSKAKLEAVVAKCKLQNAEIIIADAADLEALKAMCRRAKAVASTVSLLSVPHREVST